MGEKQMDVVLQRGNAGEITETLLGKDGEDEEDDSYIQYIAPKKGHPYNDHMIVWGASGTGKSRGVIKPFILKVAQRMESIVLVDTKGELYESTAEYMKSKGYLVRAYNLLDLENSDGFNCIYDIEQDPELVRSVAEIIIQNTSNAKDRQNFWETAEKNLLTAMLHYMGSAYDDNGLLLPIEQRSLGAIYNMLASERFDKIAKRIDNLTAGHPAKAPFDLIRETPVQNRANIVMGLGNRLGVFQNRLVDCITKYNDIDLALPGQRPCAYYCIISDQDSSLEFLSSMFFSLLFSRLTDYARRHGTNGKLPVKVNVCLEEFCNVGYLGESFLRVLSVIRSRNVACQLVIQGAAQLSGRYPHKEWEEIIGNCDWQIFLGCNDHMTADYISEKCGMVTIRTDTSQMPQQPLFSPVYSSTRPYSISRSSTQRALMMPDEIMQMDNSKSLILIRGQRPLMLRKIIVEEMPEYTELTPCRVVDHIPVWRDAEAAQEKVKRETTTAKAEADIVESTPAQELPAEKKPRRKTGNSGEVMENQQTLDGYYDHPASKKARAGASSDNMPYNPPKITIEDFREDLLRAQKPIYGGGDAPGAEDIE
jgi:type IV secretion system protein VirD4